jgi:hypothetical protein
MLATPCACRSTLGAWPADTLLVYHYCTEYTNHFVHNTTLHNMVTEPQCLAGSPSSSLQESSPSFRLTCNTALHQSAEPSYKSSRGCLHAWYSNKQHYVLRSSCSCTPLVKVDEPSSVSSTSSTCCATTAAAAATAAPLRAFCTLTAKLAAQSNPEAVYSTSGC